MKKRSLLGVKLSGMPLHEIVDQSIGAIDRQAPSVTFACATPHSLVVAQNDQFFMSALNNATHIVADGTGITLASRCIGIEAGPRITGPDYFIAMLQIMSKRKKKVFFFGSTTHVLERLMSKVIQTYPGVIICGSLSPPYGDWSVSENQAMLEIINKSEPDVLWVAMTAPKQEKWVEANRHLLNVPVVASVGAAFAWVAGTIPRAPAWIGKCGLEWLYRFILEPRRMWRRNLISSPRYIALVIFRHVLNADRALAEKRN